MGGGPVWKSACPLLLLAVCYLCVSGSANMRRLDSLERYTRMIHAMSDWGLRSGLFFFFLCFFSILARDNFKCYFVPCCLDMVNK